MKTNSIMVNGTLVEFKTPYVLLERCNLSEINSYRHNNSLNPETRDDFSITSNTEESEEEDENDVYSLEFVTQLFGDGKIFRSYVLLERLSPHDIQNLLNKKN